MEKKIQQSRHTLDSFFETIDMELECYEEDHEVSYDEDQDMQGDAAGGVIGGAIGGAVGGPIRGAVGGAVGSRPGLRRRRPKPKKKPKKLVLKKRQVVKVKAIDALINYLVQERNLDHNIRGVHSLSLC